MNYPVDTHALIWFITDDLKLPPSIKQEIENPSNSCLVSIAALWELGIKYSTGRIELNVSLQEILSIIEKSQFELLPIAPNHIIENSNLPFHHRDPFDRLIIAQAIAENLIVISKDEEFKRYNIKLKWN